jgi:hypothetical protein
MYGLDQIAAQNTEGGLLKIIPFEEVMIFPSAVKTAG